MSNKFRLTEIKVENYIMSTEIQDLDTQDILKVKLPTSLFFRDELVDIKEEIESDIPQDLIFECNSLEYMCIKQAICNALRDFLYVN